MGRKSLQNNEDGIDLREQALARAMPRTVITTARLSCEFQSDGHLTFGLRMRHIGAVPRRRCADVLAHGRQHASSALWWAPARVLVAMASALATSRMHKPAVQSTLVPDLLGAPRESKRHTERDLVFSRSFCQPRARLVMGR